MDPLATPVELATYMQTASSDEVAAGSNDGLDTAVATLALQLASGAVRSACGWSISSETVTGARVEVYSDRIFLPTLRLTALALSVGGVPLLEGSDFTFRSNGVVSFLPTVLWAPVWYGDCVATYTHGYDTVPDVVKDVVLEAAAQRVANPELLASTTIDGVTSTRRPMLDLRTDPRLDPYRLIPAFV